MNWPILYDIVIDLNSTGWKYENKSIKFASDYLLIKFMVYKVFGNFLPWEWTGDREQVHYGHRQQNHICWSPHVFLTEYNDDKWVADHGDNKVHWDNVSVDENCQIQWPAPFRCIDVVTRLVIEARTQRTDLEEGKKRNPFVL